MTEFARDAAATRPIFALAAVAQMSSGPLRLGLVLANRFGP
jgi:hypothetical protein